MNPTASTPFPDVPERIAQIIYVLCQTVTMRLRVRALTQAQVTYIVGRLLGIRRRFQGLVARIRAGKAPKERARKPRPGAANPEAEVSPGFRPPPRGWRRWAPRAEKPMPLWRALRQHRSAWLCALAPAVPGFRESAPVCAEQLRRLLAEPEMQALLMSCRLVGDSLRSVCWMLGVERSLLYPEPTVAAPPAATPPFPVATPTEVISVTQPTAARVAPEQNHVFVDATPALTGAQAASHVFTPD